nr:reverse transcriptase domain-containing protein [Tanacetum cinerariifolium]
MMTSEQFFGLEKDNPYDHIRWFNKITSTIKYQDVPNSSIKLMLFPFSLAGAACRWLEKELPRSLTTWEDFVSKFINEFFPPSRTTSLCNEILNFEQKFSKSFHEAWDKYKDLLRACPYHGFTELHQLNTFYNDLNHTDQDSLNAAAGGNLLERSTQELRLRLLRKLVLPAEVLIRIISVLPPVATLSRNSGIISKDTFQQPQFNTIRQKASPAIVEPLRIENPFLEGQFQEDPPKDPPKVPMTDNRTMAEMLRAPTEGYAEAIIVPPILAEQFELKHSLINMMTSEQFFGLEKFNPHDHIRCAMTKAMTSMLKQFQATPPPAPVKAVEETRVTCGAAVQYNQGNPGYRPPGMASQTRPPAITTRSGLVIDGPTIPTPSTSINKEVDERVEETFTDPDLAEYTIKDKGYLDKEDPFDAQQILFEMGACILGQEEGKDSSLKDSSIQTDSTNLDDYFVDPIPEMFTEEHAPDYSSPSKFDVVDDLPSPDNEDKVFNPGILIHEKSVTIITRVAQEKKLARSYASLVFKDFEPPFCAPLFFKDIPKSRMLLLFSTKNKEKVFKPGIHTSGKIHSCFLPELSCPGYHVFKINQIFISLMKIFLVQCGKNTHIMSVLLFYFYPLNQSSMGETGQA